jgi:hypothetical protein
MSLLDQGAPVASESIDVETAQRVVEGFVAGNVLFAVFGSAVFAALTVKKLRRYRLDGKEPVAFLIQPTDEEYDTLVKTIIEKHRGKQISY